MKEKVICIVGPTASGKSGLGIQLAKKIDGEIISADSMQIYKGLDIATAKVTTKEMQNIKHHIIDICEPIEKFSVADFKAMCYDKIKQILKSGKTPIIVGGTGLYINAVVNDMNFVEEEIDIEYREKLYNLAKEKSNKEVYEILLNLDPNSAKQIHPNNLKRVIRAIEIAKFSNKKKSDHMQEEIKRINNGNINYDFKVFYIDIPRDVLYERINTRVDQMINLGLIDEAKKVYELNLPSSATCMQAIGYKEFFNYFECKESLNECVEKLKQETRKYAKRQITWFKNKLDIYSIDGQKDKQELIQEILNNI